MNVIKPIVVRDRLSLVEMCIGNDVLNFATYLQYIATQLFWTAIFKHQKYRYHNRFTLLRITFLKYKQYVEIAIFIYNKTNKSLLRIWHDY